MDKGLARCLHSTVCDLVCDLVCDWVWQAPPPGAYDVSAKWETGKCAVSMAR